MIGGRVACRAVTRDDIIRSVLASGATASVAFLLALALPAERLGAFGAPLVIAAVVAAHFAWRPVGGVVVFGLVVLMSESVTYWTGEDLRYVDEAMLVFLAAVSLTLHRRRLSILRPGWREAALVGLMAAGIASSLVNGVPPGVWVPALALLMKGFAFFYLVLSLPIDADDIGQVMAPLAAVGFVILALGLVEFVAPDVATALGVPPYLEQRGAVQVVTSLFTQPSLYGWLAVFISLFLIARFAAGGAWWSLGLAVLLGGASVLSGRRTPLVAWVIAAVVGGIQQSRWRTAAARVWLTVGIGMIAVVVASLPILGGFYQSTIDDYFGTAGAVGEVFAEDPDPEVVRPLHPRVALYAGSLAVARDEFPLGAGFGRYGSHTSRDTYSPVYARYGLERVYGLRERRPIAITDTFWPMVLGESGVAGLLAAIAFLGLLGRDLWRAAAPTGTIAVRVFTLGAFLVYVEALVRSTASGVFVAPPIVYWVFGAAALSLAVRRDVSSRSADAT
jgi:hypothetical protein